MWQAAHASIASDTAIIIIIPDCRAEAAAAAGAVVVAVTDVKNVVVTVVTN